MAYKSNWNSYDHRSEFLHIENATITHYKGYDAGGVATRTTDMCVYMTGTDGSYIKDSTFDDCGTGIYTVRSPYYYTHSTTEYGADNLTIEGNEFLNGGEIADIWVGRNAYSEGMLIKGNWFNSSSSDGGVEVFNGFTERVTVQDNYFNGPRTAVQMIGTDGYVIDNNEIIGTSEAGHAGIEIDAGYGVISNNTILDADGGIYLEDSENPPAPTTSLCAIGSRAYTYSSTCSFTVPSGVTVYVDLQSDSYGDEISLEITKPDGSTDTWSQSNGYFADNYQYKPLTSYTAAGQYSLKVLDSYGDGGANIAVYYGNVAVYGGPSSCLLYTSPSPRD